jgi:hypothetical protein
MYGKVAFGFSGGNSGVKAIVHRNPVIDVSYDAVPRAYTKAGRRRDAINFITGTDRLLPLAPGAALAHDVGFRFGDLPATTLPGNSVDLVWSRFAHTTWTWSAAQKAYLRSMDGAPAMLRGGKRQSAPNVVVQYVTVRNGNFTDVNGAPSPYTKTNGTGKVVVLRDGKAVSGTWQRLGTGPTRFLTKDGHDIRLRPGPVWIMLVPNDLHATVK